MDDFSFVGNSDIASIEELYRKYLENPESIDASFAHFFKGFDFAISAISSTGISVPQPKAQVSGL